MNILFLTTGRMDSIEQHSLYPDLLRCFRDNGHNVYTVSAYEKRSGRETEYIEDCGVYSLHVKIGNLTKTNLIEKGISTVSIEAKYKKAIRKYLVNVKFDLIMYSTPPITLSGVIKYIKHRDNAKTYLLLKDIFPQNAVDLGMMTKTGIKSVLYKYFRHKEKKLYDVSDYIGCMSQANVDYVIKHNSYVNPSVVEVCPNSIEPVDMSVDKKTRTAIREKYNIPIDKNVFVYGGNLGKPQGIDFFIKCLESCKDNEKVYFLIVGDGTEFGKLETYVKSANQINLKLMKRLPKEEYDSMVAACDVGMIFLDYRFTIPNFPSRLLSYMQAKIPVLAVTDTCTDVGKIIVDGQFGWWCESNDLSNFCKTVEHICNQNTKSFSENAWNYLCDHYNVEQAYETIIQSCKLV